MNSVVIIKETDNGWIVESGSSTRERTNIYTNWREAVARVEELLKVAQSNDQQRSE